MLARVALALGAVVGVYGALLPFTGLPGPADYATVGMVGLLLSAACCAVCGLVPRGERRLAVAGALLALLPVLVLAGLLTTSDG